MRENYTILLVDDEQEIKDRIRTKIPLDSGFEVIGEASNGYDAIDVIEQLHPDVVITDIRMPYIDGIELAKIMKQTYPKTKVAFISGYDEFAYAKEAINLDVVSYLSKPVSSHDVIEFLDKLKARLDEERQTIFSQDALNKMYQEHIQIFIENQFHSLLQLSKITHAVLNRFKVYDIDLSKGQFTVGMIEYQDSEDFLEMENLRIFLLNIVKKMFQDYGKVYTIHSSHGLIFITQQLGDIEIDFNSILYNIILLKKDFSKLKVRIGVSNTFDDFKLFLEHVQQAKHALTYSTYLNIGSIIYYKDVENNDYPHFYIDKEELEKISYLLRFGKEDDISNILERHKVLAKEYQDGQPLNKEHYIVNMTQIMLDFAVSTDTDIDDLFEKDILSTLSAINNVDELLNRIHLMMLKLMKQAENTAISGAQAVLDQAVHYLEHNYHNPDISMDYVCDQLGVSVSYISTLFRKIMKTTFNRYLVSIRMEKAKELLKFSSDKVYEIALTVGYNDVYYFSHSFKKVTGQTPKDFRNAAQNQ